MPAKRIACCRCSSSPIGKLAGRGRQGNSWWTGSGSLAFSLLFDPATFGCPRRPAPRLALAVGAAIVDAIAPRADRSLRRAALAERRLCRRWKARRRVGGGASRRPAYSGIGLNSNNSAADAPPELRRSGCDAPRSHRPDARSNPTLIDLLDCLANAIAAIGRRRSGAGRNVRCTVPSTRPAADALSRRPHRNRPLRRHRGRRRVASRYDRRPPIVLRRHASPAAIDRERGCSATQH